VERLQAALSAVQEQMSSMHAENQEQLRLRAVSREYSEQRAVSYAVSHAQGKEKEKERTLQQELNEARAGMHQLAEEAVARQKQLREIQSTRELMAKENVQLQQQVEGERRERAKERAAAQQRAMAAQSRVANLELELANLEQRNEQVQLHLHREIADLRELAGASDVKQKMAALEAEKAQLQGVLASQMADKQTRLKMSDDILLSAHQSLEETRAQLRCSQASLEETREKLRRSQASLEIEKMSGAALAAQLAALRERYLSMSMNMPLSAIDHV